MDEKGLAFTLDAVLALIPVLIILTAVANFSDAYLVTPAPQMRMSHHAQDSLDLMAQKRSSDGEAVLGQITNILDITENNNTGMEASGALAGAFLSETLPGMKYNFTEIKQLDGVTISCNGDMADAKDLSVGIRSYGDYVFKLYVWE